MLGITGLNIYLILLTTLLTTLFSNHKVDKFFNQGYSLALIDMSVEIKGDLDVTVTKSVRNNLRLYTCFEEQGSVSMAKAMDGYRF